MKIGPSRLRPQNRVATPSDKQAPALSQTYSAPIGGLLSRSLLTSPSDQTTALVLDNFWPTTSGIVPRGGSQLRVKIPNAVKALFQYRNGNTVTFFAADTSAIYAFSDQTVTGTTLTASVAGQTSGDYGVLETQTDGGVFLLLVNGQDELQLYNGTSWQAVNATSTPLALTGVDTNKLSHLWAYRNRIFFVEGGTMNAWYLGVNSVAGAATRLPLSSVFNKGGSLLFGATWSSDSGSGMDDRCVFATDRGEFAVYSGGNPGDTADWSLNGVYDLGEPLGKGALMQIGGDLIVATKTGLIPISAALSKDPSQLKLYSLSRAIEPDWRRETVLAGSLSGWRLVKQDQKNRAFVVPPSQVLLGGFCWVVNLETGAWARFTGWDIGDLAMLDGNPHYGDRFGNIFIADIGGRDNGNAFECQACFSFDSLGLPGRVKMAHMIRGVWRYNIPFNALLSVARDYQVSLGTAPSAAVESSTNNEGQWDISEWDQDEWASYEITYQTEQKWYSVAAHGEVLAPQIQITSAQVTKLDCELISVDLMYTSGNLVV